MDGMMDSQLEKARLLEKARADARPRIAETADDLHRAMASLGDALTDLEHSLRPVLRELGPNVPALLVEDPDTREGQSELHGIIRQWRDQAQSMTQHLQDLQRRVEL